MPAFITAGMQSNDQPPDFNKWASMVADDEDAENLELFYYNDVDYGENYYDYYDFGEEDATPAAGVLSTTMIAGIAGAAGALVAAAAVAVAVRKKNKRLANELAYCDTVANGTTGQLAVPQHAVI
jgi:hypothetical protein